MGNGPSLGGAGGTSFKYECAPGHVIDNVEVRDSGVISAVKVRCTDGKSSAWYGGPAGTVKTANALAGITGYGGKSSEAFIDGGSGSGSDGGNVGSASYENFSAGCEYYDPGAHDTVIHNTATHEHLAMSPAVMQNRGTNTAAVATPKQGRINQLRLLSAGSPAVFGAGDTGNVFNDVKCPPGEALNRVEGNSSTVVNRLQFWCGPYSQRQAVEAARAAAAVAAKAAAVAAAAAAAAASKAAADKAAADKAAADAAAAKAAAVAAAADKAAADKAAADAAAKAAAATAATKATADAAAAKAASDAAAKSATSASASTTAAAATTAAANTTATANQSATNATVSATAANTAAVASTAAATAATNAANAPDAATAGVAARAAEQSAANATSAAAEATKPAITTAGVVTAAGGDIKTTPVPAADNTTMMWVVLFLFLVVVGVFFMMSRGGSTPAYMPVPVRQ